MPDPTIRIEETRSGESPPLTVGGAIGAAINFLNPLNVFSTILASQGPDIHRIAGVDINLRTGAANVLFEPVPFVPKVGDAARRESIEFQRAASEELTRALQSGTLVTNTDRRLVIARQTVNDLIRGGYNPDQYAEAPAPVEAPPLPEEPDEVPEPEPPELEEPPPVLDYGPTVPQSLPENAFYAPQYRGGGVPIMVPMLPPGGFAGFAQQTPAAQRAMRIGGNGTGRRRKRRAKKVAGARRRKRRSSKKPARLVKGSAAAKRYMASIRRKRRK